MAQSGELPAPWADQPRRKEFTVTLEGNKTPLHIGNCAIGLFRQRPEMDYLAIKDDDEAWTLVFDKHPLLYWMGDIAIGRDARHQLHLVERNQGKFADRYGWNPSTIVDDYPSDWEIDAYIAYEASGLADPHQDLERALRDDFET